MTTRLPSSARLLVVEHDTGIQDLLATFLTSEGYDVSLAASPDEACTLLHEQNFHLVLTDLFSNSRNDRFCAAERLSTSAHPTPVGVITGWHVEEDEIAQHDFAFVIRKPFDVEALVDTITACVPSPLYVREA